MKKKKFRVMAFIPITLSCLLLANGLAAQEKSQELDRLFSYYHENGMFNGAVLAAENGKVIYSKTFGFSDFENKKSLDASSVFNIASTTKPFTALGIMMLQERGKLSYADKLSDYFPEFPAYAKGITIRHLLTHTSGMIDFLNDLHLHFQHPVLTTRMAFDALVRQPALKFKSGEKFAYSNSGYLLLAMIIEKVSGKTYREFMAENIFQPLGMTHTCAYDETTATPASRVNAYRNIWQKSEVDLEIQSIGDGNIFSTTGDLFLFDQALYGETLVRQSTLREAYDTTRLTAYNKRGDTYGFGWHIQGGEKGQVVYHHGGAGGFRCQYWRNLSKKDTLIILGNNTWLSACPEIMSGAQNIMLARPFAFAKVSITEKFFELWYLRGFELAIKVLRDAMANARAQYDFSEGSINDLGYTFINRSEFRRAVEIFTINTELYPESANTFDSLGEAYLKAGDKERAIVNYEKSLQLDPQNAGAAEILKKLRENN